MAATLRNRIAIIAGAGPGTGAAVSRRFAKAYPVVLLARSRPSLDTLVAEIEESGGSAVGITADVTNPISMGSAINDIRAQFGPNLSVGAAIFNVASKFTRKAFLESSAEEFLGSLEGTAKGAYNFSQSVLPLLLAENQGDLQPQHPSTLIFTGATAAMKGGSGLGSFAMSKFAVRAMAQSLAREFGPQGVHVAHVIVDGIIDTEKTKAFNTESPDSKIDPKMIAESYWFLHAQDRTAFTHELDLRPYCETW
ncbi:hypothetical protein BBP40_006166 [Aspergillus hancockii]|nr:hypothetical protein BBP40_006166 [Aspergillus hancockii]